MSAVNVFCGSRRACVLTDASVYDFSTGKIINFEPKAFPVESWTGVIAGRGNCWWAYVVPYAESFASFDEFLIRSAPEIESAHRAGVNAGTIAGSQTFVEIHAVGWSERRDRPEAYVLTSPRARGDGIEDLPYVWRSLDSEDHGGVFLHALFNAGELWQLHRQGAEPDIDWTVDTFDPIRHGIPLMETQRRRPTTAEAGEDLVGKHVIGGDLWLTVVDREGVRQDIIHTWEADQIGEPIRPEPLDEASLPKIPPAGMPLSWPFERFDRAVKAGAINPETHEPDMAAIARLEANVPAGAGLSRQQRRAAKARSRKLARA